MPHPTDEKLIQRVVRLDDRGAYGELVRRHQSAVRGLLRRLTCGDAELADDLAQETFLRAYLALGGFRAAARFSTWLYRIAYNLFLQSRRRPGEIRDRNPEGPRPALNGDRAARSLLQVDLERAMRRLSEAERSAIACCYALDLSHQEAAFVLECPLGTVKTHILRAKQKLRVQLLAWKAME